MPCNSWLPGSPPPPSVQSYWSAPASPQTHQWFSLARKLSQSLGFSYSYRICSSLALNQHALRTAETLVSCFLNPGLNWCTVRVIKDLLFQLSVSFTLSDPTSKTSFLTRLSQTSANFIKTWVLMVSVVKAAGTQSLVNLRSHLLLVAAHLTAIYISANSYLPYCSSNPYFH